MPTKIFRIAIIVSLLGLGLSACEPTKDQPKNEVTGKGNGGNGLAMSEQEIAVRFTKIKPQLTSLFEGLADLAEAETLIESSTDLSEFPELLNLIITMVEPRSGKNVFDDIETANNFEILNEPCIDDEGIARVGATRAGDVGGRICFSVSELRKISPKGAEAAVDIQVLSIAAHEFGHHYLNGTAENDETTLRTFQAFINYQLHRFDQMPTEGVISMSDTPFLDEFRSHAAKILKLAKNSAAVRGVSQ